MSNNIRTLFGAVLFTLGSAAFANPIVISVPTPPIGEGAQLCIDGIGAPKCDGNPVVPATNAILTVSLIADVNGILGVTQGYPDECRVTRPDGTVVSYPGIVVNVTPSSAAASLSASVVETTTGLTVLDVGPVPVSPTLEGDSVRLCLPVNP